MKYKLLLIVLILSVFLSLSLLFNNSKEEVLDSVGDQKEETKESVGSIDNQDIIGEIKIKGTNISDYIVKTDNNDYYLNHNIKKEEDISGAVFMDYRNNYDDKKILIFGHNAQRLKTVPFHDLEKFKDKSFYEKFKYIDLKLNEEKSKWLIFSVMIVPKTDNSHMILDYTNQEWINYLKWLKDNSIYNTNVDVNENDRIVILQTCNYEPNNTYLLISAKKV